MSGRSSGSNSSSRTAYSEQAKEQFLKNLDDDLKKHRRKNDQTPFNLKPDPKAKKLLDSIIESSGISTVLEYQKGKNNMSFDKIEMLEMGLSAIDKELKNFNELGALQVNKRTEKAHQIIRLSTAALGGIVSEIKSIRLEIKSIRLEIKSIQVKGTPDESK